MGCGDRKASGRLFGNWGSRGRPREYGTTSLERLPEDSKNWSLLKLAIFLLEAETFTFRTASRGGVMWSDECVDCRAFSSPGLENGSQRHGAGGSRTAPTTLDSCLRRNDVVRSSFCGRMTPTLICSFQIANMPSIACEYRAYLEKVLDEHSSMC